MTSMLKTAAGNPENQDRGAVIHCGSGLVLVVADGAGGMSGGKEAAVMAVEFVRQKALQICDLAGCAKVLSEIDGRVTQGLLAAATNCALAAPIPALYVYANG